MKYETVIGLEVHAELATKTKIFCDCKNAFGGEPNTRVCPVCMGMPGALPVLNKQVVAYAIKAGLAMNCSITGVGRCDRKNYFYPDLPKAYQISQLDSPVCQNGYIDIDVAGETKRIGITRIHIEEDAGKLVHDPYSNTSMADYNRCGVPLIEIVTEPDLRSPEEARIFLENLKSILEYTGVSDCKMQEGSLRCDVNISMRPMGQKELGTRCEMKNVNSFSAAYRALLYEQKRQTEILEDGDVVEQETRRWDDPANHSTVMRTKENAMDYRYFPEPDLIPIVISDAWIEDIRKTLPELPRQRRTRYMNDYSISQQDAGVITASKPIADYFEICVANGVSPKIAANWLMGDVLSVLNKNNMEAADMPFSAEQLAKLIKLTESGRINHPAAKKVLDILFESPNDPELIVEQMGLTQLSDEDTIMEIVDTVLDMNTRIVEDYKSGKEKAFAALVGQVMKLSKGKANPIIANKLLKERLQK